MKQSQSEEEDERAPIAARWVDQVGRVDLVGGQSNGDGPAARAGALLRQARAPEALDASRLGAIRARLRRDARRPQRHWSLRLAIALGLVLTGSALTAGAQLYFHILGPARPAPPEITPMPTSRPHARSGKHAARAALAPETEAAVPLPLPLPDVEPAAPRADEVSAPASIPLPAPQADAPASPASPRPRAAVARVAAPPPALIPAADPTPPSAPFVPPADVTPPPAQTTEPASALAQESALLATALRKLRQDADPGAALAIIDEHDRLFGAGTLAPEATLARIEALIGLHRNDDALALLNRAAPSPLGRGRDLLIARAELRAAAGRCGSATRDFDLLLIGDLAFDAPAERALWGRASCRAAAGDTPGARRDLQDYLARFPTGRFARDARAALGQ